MSALKLGLIMSAALMLSASVAVAQETSRPCASDIKTLCAGIRPGEGRLKACIKSHLSGLSQACEDRLLTVALTAKVCEKDVADLCKGIAPGKGLVRACLKSRMSEVSDTCKESMSRTGAGRKLLGGDL
jgi:hypothetical protein